MKPSRFVFALALPMLFAPAIARADTKLAYVDLQRAIQETDEGHAAYDKLQATLQAKQKEIDGEQEQLRKEKETLDKQASAMSEDTKAQKTAELQKKLYTLAQKYEGERQELQVAQQKTLSALFDKMNPIIAQIAQSEGITMVFDKQGSGLVYAPPAADITNELVRQYNAKYHGSGADSTKSTGSKK